MDVHSFLSYCRKAAEENPALSPCDLEDFFGVLAVLSSMTVSAELAESAADRAIAATVPERRAALAERFRRERGGA